MAHTWYTQWKDNRSLIVGPISWEVFRREFHKRFFPREKREVKVEEFIILYQGGLTMQEYSLKFIKFAKSSSLLSNPRDEMSFVSGVSYPVEKCRPAMIHDSMDFHRLMVRAQQVEKSSLKRKNRDAKRRRANQSSYFKV